MTAALPEDDDIAAAELALGVLEAAHADAAAARAAAEPVFAARVDWWRDHFAELLDAIAAPPPAALWTRIDAALPANDNLAAALRRWRIAAGFGFLLAAGLAIALMLRPQPSAAPGAEMLASLDGKAGHVATIAWNPVERRLTIVPGAMPHGDRAAKLWPELWIIPAGGTPRSLGVIAAEHRSQADVSEARAALIRAGGTFAITLEPLGGSPNGMPSGPAVAAGTIS